MGPRGARACAPRGQADLPLDRLRGLPLVPRHGARVVRGRRDGGGPQRGLRGDQGGPRGAARPRPGLHERGRVDDRAGRLAAQRLPHARPQAVLRRHLLPRHEPPRAAVVPRPARRDPPGVDRAPERGGAGRPPAGRRDDRGPTIADRGDAPGTGRARRGGPQPRDPVRLGQRRLGARTEVPAADGDRVPAQPVRRDRRHANDRDGPSLPGPDGRRRHPRPPRRRLRALLDRRASGSCRTSRRCSTTTRSSPARTSTRSR